MTQDAPVAAPAGRMTPDRIALASLVVATAVLYSLTLCPTVYWYDSAEFSAHAVTLGVPHPPGYPLYTMVAHLFTWLPGEPALGVNRMSLVFGMGAVAILYALIRQVGGSLRAGVLGAATLATIRTFWSNAIVAEVYTPGLVMTLGALLILVRAHERRWRRGVIVAGLVGGLGVGMHMSITTFGLGYAWLAWTYDLPERMRPSMLAARLRGRVALAASSGLAAAAGLLVFAYVPLRKFERWDVYEWTVFRKNSSGGAFRRKFLQDYDFGDRLALVSDLVVDNVLIVGVALAVVGLAALLRRRPKTGIGVLLAGGGNAWWFFNYQVPDLDVFYLPSLAVLCVGIGLSSDTLAAPLRRMRERLGFAAWLLLLLPAVLVSRNFDAVDLSRASGAAEYGRAACDVARGPVRIVNYSSPDEWRYYSVFIYMQATDDRCAQAEVWKKPRSFVVGAAVRRGDVVYAFRPLEGLRARFRVTPAGPLWRLEPRRARRRTAPNTRVAPVAQ